MGISAGQEDQGGSGHGGGDEDVSSVRRTVRDTNLPWVMGFMWLLGSRLNT